MDSITADPHNRLTHILLNLVSTDVYKRQCLCHLIGLGIGLTPSGDDFLCGFLAGLRLSDGSSVFLPFLEQHILHTLDRTNEISAAFLRCAVLGQFSAPVHLLTDQIGRAHV